MKPGKIEKDVLKQIPQLSVVDGYFYIKDTKNILRGFVYEKQEAARIFGNGIFLCIKK